VTIPKIGHYTATTYVDAPQTWASDGNMLELSVRPRLLRFLGSPRVLGIIAHVGHTGPLAKLRCQLCFAHRLKYPPLRGRQRNHHSAVRAGDFIGQEVVRDFGLGRLLAVIATGPVQSGQHVVAAQRDAEPEQRKTESPSLQVGQRRPAL
jgi:hypothetical protein